MDHQVGETIRQAAERTAERLLVKTATVSGQPEDVAQLYFVGNCPAGWFWRVAEEEQSNGNTDYGDKVSIIVTRARMSSTLSALLISRLMCHGRIAWDEQSNHGALCVLLIPFVYGTNLG